MKSYKAFLIPFLVFICFISCTKNNDENPNPDNGNTISKIVILYTNDEHGWMEANENYSGATGMFNLWKTREGYNGADSFLIISGGDMWTGPAISTWFKGESMIEVMNAMEYDVAALGNHEFDFTTNTLNHNTSLMNFPLIAANVKDKNTGEIPSFIQPYYTETINNIKIGIIGLASTSTPYTAFPDYVENYNFTDYEEAIIEYTDILKELDTDIIIVVGHISENEMLNLTSLANSLGIVLITGGHSHQYVSRLHNNVKLIEAGSNLKAYAKIVIEYDHEENNSEIISSELVYNSESGSDNTIQLIIDKWWDLADQELSEVIGYCSQTIGRSSTEMANMVTDSWLYVYPQADIAITNSGGIRQDIATGEITIGDIVGVLPFTNTIYELKLTGEEVIDCIGNYVIGGMTTVGGYTLSDGSPIEGNTVYSVITTDYLYSLPNSKFAQYDPEPYNTSISYYQPTVDWIKSKSTSNQDPINNYLDFTPRK